jgi:hypothetical protein
MKNLFPRMLAVHLPCCFAAAAVLTLSGCRATAPAARGPDAVFLAAEYPAMHLESLAYLGTASLQPDPIGPTLVDGLLTSYLTGGQQKFIVTDEATLRLRARREGLEGDLNSVIDAWKSQHVVERFALKRLAEKLRIDGIVLGDLTRWRTEQVDWQSEGNSFTEVGITLSMYDAGTGVLAWKAERMERQESAHYRHGQGVGSGTYQERGGSGTERTERADKIAPKPPDPQIVAENVVQSLMMGLPDKPSSGVSKK